MELVFDTNRADVASIEAHLKICDTHFVPHLSKVVDLAAYATKLLSQGLLFEAWLGGRIVGLVAGYANDPQHEDSFISNVSILPDWHGQGVANQLLSTFIDHVRNKGFTRVVLKVDARNDRAQSLYRKHGFINGPSEGNVLEMRLKLRTKNDHET
jgi:ribosomal protein S18 acetylase RimI-like enzyme